MQYFIFLLIFLTSFNLLTAKNFDPLLLKELTNLTKISCGNPDKSQIDELKKIFDEPLIQKEINRAFVKIKYDKHNTHKQLQQDLYTLLHEGQIKNQCSRDEIIALTNQLFSISGLCRFHPTVQMKAKEKLSKGYPFHFTGPEANYIQNLLNISTYSWISKIPTEKGNVTFDQQKLNELNKYVYPDRRPGDILAEDFPHRVKFYNKTWFIDHPDDIAVILTTRTTYSHIWALTSKQPTTAINISGKGVWEQEIYFASQYYTRQFRIQFFNLLQSDAQKKVIDKTQFDEIVEKAINESAEIYLNVEKLLPLNIHNSMVKRMKSVLLPAYHWQSKTPEDLWNKKRTARNKKIRYEVCTEFIGLQLVFLINSVEKKLRENLFTDYPKNKPLFHSIWNPHTNWSAHHTGEFAKTIKRGLKKGYIQEIKKDTGLFDSYTNRK